MQYLLKHIDNRTLENDIKKGLEPDSDPKYSKNSADCSTLELFVNKFYNEITRILNLSVFTQIENLSKIS